MTTIPARIPDAALQQQHTDLSNSKKNCRCVEGKGGAGTPPSREEEAQVGDSGKVQGCGGVWMLDQGGRKEKGERDSWTEDIRVRR